MLILPKTVKSFMCHSAEQSFSTLLSTTSPPLRPLEVRNSKTPPAQKVCILASITLRWLVHFLWKLESKNISSFGNWSFFRLFTNLPPRSHPHTIGFGCYWLLYSNYCLISSLRVFVLPGARFHCLWKMSPPRKRWEVVWPWASFEVFQASPGSWHLTHLKIPEDSHSSWKT